MDHKSKPATTKEVLEELREMIEILWKSILVIMIILH
jgi:hypothetical protein